MTLTVQTISFLYQNIEMFEHSQHAPFQNETSLDPSLFHLWNTFQLPHNSPCHLLNIFWSKEWGQVLNRIVLCLLSSKYGANPAFTVHRRELKCVLTVVMETGSKEVRSLASQWSAVYIHWHLNLLDSVFLFVFLMEIIVHNAALWN